MLILDDTFAFVHLPRTGGYYFTAAAPDAVEFKPVHVGKTDFYFTFLPYVEARRHKLRFEEYRYFAFLRDPYEWTVSMFLRFNKPHNDFRSCPLPSIDDTFKRQLLHNGEEYVERYFNEGNTKDNIRAAYAWMGRAAPQLPEERINARLLNLGNYETFYDEATKEKVKQMSVWTRELIARVD